MPSETNNKTNALSFESIAKLGFSLTTLATAYLYVLGTYYWNGFLSTYSLTVWDVGISPSRLLVPCGTCIALFVHIALGYVAFGELVRIRRAIRKGQAVNEQFESHLGAVGLPHKAPTGSEHLGPIAAKTWLLRGDALVTTDDKAIASLTRSALCAGFPAALEKQISELSDSHFLWLLTKMVILKHADDRHKGEANIYRPMQAYLAERVPGEFDECRFDPTEIKYHKWLLGIGVIWSGLTLILTPISLIPQLLGLLLGFLLVMVDSFSKVNRYWLRWLIVVITISYGYWAGKRIDPPRLTKVVVLLKQTADPLHGKQVSRDDHGVFVIYEGDGNPNNTPQIPRVRYIQLADINELRY